MKYQIIRCDGSHSLENDVAKYISGGWEPLGGPFVLSQVTLMGTVVEWCQAMIFRPPYKKTCQPTDEPADTRQALEFH